MNQQLSWRTIVGYSLGDVANNFAFAMGALFLLSYYTDVAGVAVSGVDGPIYEAHPVTVQLRGLLLAQAEQTVEPPQEMKLQR
ncbi:MAG: hypothetical protein IH920_03460 [Chloroflexi bacterium]|nr:hypothetical protein [Chloroflexota bacterium]